MSVGGVAGLNGGGSSGTLASDGMDLPLHRALSFSNTW